MHTERPQDELDEVPFSEAELEPDQMPVVATATPRPDEPQPSCSKRADVPVVADVAAEPIEPTFAEPTMPSRRSSRLAVEAAHSSLIRALADDCAAPSSATLTTAAAPGRPAPEPAAGHAAPLRREPRAIPGMIALSDLAADLVLGRTHLVVLAGHRSSADCEALAEELVGDALSRGLSVALVDAGSARQSEEPGLTDLSLEAASFGDVVHKSADNSFAEVPWGHGRDHCPPVRQAADPGRGARRHL